MSFSLSMILALIATSMVTVVSQTLFKQAVTALAPAAAATSHIGRFMALLTMPIFIIALFLYFLAFVIWVWLLSKSSLSILYPIGLSLNVVFALISAQIFLHESTSALHMIGIAIIIVGIFLVTR